MLGLRLAVVVAALFGLAGAARAETLLLVQGYLASPANWRASGVAGALVSEGWRDAGHLALTPAGPLAPAANAAGRRFLTLDLPTEAPLGEQARLIALHVAAVKAQGEDAIVLVGHSAGGVAARMAMVVSRDPAV